VPIPDQSDNVPASGNLATTAVSHALRMASRNDLRAAADPAQLRGRDELGSLACDLTAAAWREVLHIHQTRTTGTDTATDIADAPTAPDQFSAVVATATGWTAQLITAATAPATVPVAHLEVLLPALIAALAYLIAHDGPVAAARIHQECVATITAITEGHQP
jgi:hypothetical protein